MIPAKGTHGAATTFEGVLPVKITGEWHIGVAPLGARSPVRLLHRDEGMYQRLTQIGPIGLEYPPQRSASLDARLAPVDPAAAISEVSGPFRHKLD